MVLSEGENINKCFRKILLLNISMSKILVISTLRLKVIFGDFNASKPRF